MMILRTIGFGLILGVYLMLAGYAVVCLAVGLVASSLAYPPMERGIHTLIRLVLPRWICARPAAVAASSGETARPGVA